MSLAFAPSPATLPGVVGDQLRVPLVTGEQVSYANLDHAASAPCLEPVRRAVDELLPWYASVHRGAGLASQVCTRVYERARDVLRRFVGARPDAAVVFTRNTTDALNLLARALPKGTTVVRFDSDHHAALLPWRGRQVRRVGVPASPEEAIAALDRTLAACPVGPRLVVLTGASNVTGEVWPIAELSAVARRHGARVVLDAAQLAPHRPVRATEWDVDWVALSGHKLYAPFGAGALVGVADWLRAAEPYLIGGGATRQVVDLGERLGVSWAAVPERHEAGSPNVIGVHALAAACDALCELGWDTITAHEQVLVETLRAGLGRIPGVRQLALWAPDHPRVGVVSFAVDGVDPGLLATALSAEHGVGVRDGAFCAHLTTRSLLTGAGVDGERALRASIGLGTNPEHVERFLGALARLVEHDPRWCYRLVDGRWTPDPDPRPLPSFLDGDVVRGGAPCGSGTMTG
ncbi:cysteine desulfurase [Longimycelium tulufanense]|uniref:Cysteine desulfurase n=1 Tax=Longimycelium tulufanense TaxID=907463 RepID=A0A8J3CA68_9PSEU|nr:aminotransferase class V-fold PLP-dependent enzyme [Longimycelium tulufanense]GGM37722.1 cysteine desulfurase [Longimycelium tulufanense]